MELTATHRQVLETIGSAGATRDKLGDLAASPALRELIDAGLVTYDPVVLRETLAPGHVLAGPAIIEQEDSTSVIEPGWSGTVDEAGSIIVKEQGR